VFNIFWDRNNQNLQMDPRATSRLVEEKQKDNTMNLEKELKAKRNEIVALQNTIDRERRKKKSLKKFNRHQSQVEPENDPPKKRENTSPIESTIRVLVAEKINSGEMKWMEAQCAYDISHSSVGRILAESRKRKEDEEKSEAGLEVDEPPKKKKRGAHPKLSGETLLAILDWIEDDSGVTLKEIVSRLFGIGIQVSISTVHKYFKQLDVSYKNVLKIPFNWNSDSVIDLRKKYVLKLLSIPSKQKIFVDECGFNLCVRRKKG